MKELEAKAFVGGLKDLINTIRSASTTGGAVKKMSDSYPELRALLLREHKSGGLRVIAAKSKLSEGLLRDIVTEGEVLTNIVAEKLLKVVT